MPNQGLRATARSLGIDHAYLKRLADTGTVPRAADGTFDVGACRAAIKANTDPAMVRKPVVTKAGDRSPGKPKPVTTPAEARDAVALVARVLKEEGVASDGVDYPAARLADTILKARDRELKIAERQRKLVPMSAVKDHVSKAFIGFRQTIQRMPSRHVHESAARLGCDPGLLQTELDQMIAATLSEMSAPAVRG